MPGFSSLISYRRGKRTKATILKVPFSLLRGDSTTTTSSAKSHQQFKATDVIDINNSTRSSLDFDVGKPFEVSDDPESTQHNLSTGTSPQVELDIDLSNDFSSEWLQTISGDAKQAAMKRLTLKNLVSLKLQLEESKKEGRAGGGGDLPFSLDDIMDASHFHTPPEHDDILQKSSSLIPPSSITAQDFNHQASPADLFIATRTSRPLSSQSDATASSALSGTTLARALMSNSFTLSPDRSSIYRTGTGAGLTRSDSNTLPRGERSRPSTFYNDRFSIGLDAPPIPTNAEFLYEPPRKPRNEDKCTKRNLRRRSSTGSLSPKIPPDTPSISSNIRRNSVIINADVDFDLETFIPKTPRVKPSIPLPHSPTPRLTINEAPTPDPANTFQGVAQHIPMDAQLLLPDSNIPSPALSEGRISSKELDGLLNYYSISDSPAVLVAGGVFRPMFSPISEESSSQLSPPVPYRCERRDSQRNQPVGARSPLSGNFRVRADSILLPRKDQRACPRPHILLPVGEAAQANVEPVSPTTPGSFYFTENDSPEASSSPSQLSKISNRKMSGSAPSPIGVARNSTDMNAYNITLTSGDAIPSEEDIMVSQEFPQSPDPFSPVFSAISKAPSMTFPPGDGHETSPVPNIPTSVIGRSNSFPAAQLLLKRASVRRPRQGSLSKIRTTTAAWSGSPPKSIPEISESPEAKLSTLSPTGDPTTEAIPQSRSEPSARQSHASLSLGASRSPSQGPNTGLSDAFNSMYLMDIDPTSRLGPKSLPAIPMTSPIIPLSPDCESPPVSLPGSSTTSAVFAEPAVAPPSPTPEETVKLPIPRGKLPPALSISNHSRLSGHGLIALNGADQSAPDSPELELQQPQYDSPEGTVTNLFSTQDPFSQSSLGYENEAFQNRASDIFRGTSLGSPPPYYSVVSEAMMRDNRSPNFHTLPSSYHSQGSDNIAGPSSAESSFSNDNGRNFTRENSALSQRARLRPPLPAGPRRPSQQLPNSPAPQRGSFSSVGGTSSISDLRARPPTRPNHLAPVSSPSFQTPMPKWKGFTMEVAKWTFTSAQLQDIVARAIRQSAEASSVRLLRLEVLDNEIPEEVQRLETQRTDIKMRYKALTRKRATIIDSLYYSLGAVEDANSTHRVLQQLDKLKEVAQTLDRLAEEIHSVDQQLSHLESLTRIHTSSALAMALRKLNTSFLKQVAENQILRSRIQALEAERDEAWQQAQDVANEYDQITDNISSPSRRSSRVSARRKSSTRVSRAGLRSGQRSSGGGGTPISSLSAVGRRSPPPPMPKRRPMDLLMISPARNSVALSTSGVTPTTGSRALARAQDELYAMLGIINPECRLHRSRSDSCPGTPATARSPFFSPRSAESSHARHSSLPGALSLAEAYNVMAADRNAVLATIDMLSPTK